MRLSIRLRLTAWYAAALLAGLALFGSGMWIALEQRLIAGVDQRLAQRVEGLRNALGAEAVVLGDDDELVPSGACHHSRNSSAKSPMAPWSSCAIPRARPC